MGKIITKISYEMNTEDSGLDGFDEVTDDVRTSYLDNLKENTMKMYSMMLSNSFHNIKIEYIYEKE